MIKLILVLALSSSFSHDVELNSFESMNDCVSSLVELHKSVKDIKDSDLICLSVESEIIDNPFN
jgi:hypothetical protein